MQFSLLVRYEEKMRETTHTHRLMALIWMNEISDWKHSLLLNYWIWANSNSPFSPVIFLPVLWPLHLQMICRGVQFLVLSPFSISMMMIMDGNDVSSDHWADWKSIFYRGVSLNTSGLCSCLLTCVQWENEQQRGRNQSSPLRPQATK